MIPVLYTKDGSEVIGSLNDTISAVVTEQKNTYTANFTYPFVSDYFSQINYDSIVLLKPNQKSNPQMFRITSISKPINGVVSYGCEHISYELNKNPIMVVTLPEGTASDMLTRVLINTMVDNYYVAQSDISGTKKCELDFMSAREAILKVQQYFGGELEWDNYRVILHSSRGADNGTVISYGNNLIDYTKKTDVSNVYTAISPYMQISNNDGSKTTYYLPEKYLTYSNAPNYSYVRSKAVDLTDKFTEDELKSITQQAIIEKLRVKAQMYMVENPPTDVVHNVTLSYVDLRKAKEFAAIETMNDLGLYDYVTVMDQRLGVNFTGQVITTRYNVLTEMYESIEIGNPTEQLLDSLASIVNFKSNVTIGETVNKIEKNLDEYFSGIRIEDNLILFASGNVKNVEGVYNTYKYILERDTDIQAAGKKGRIIGFRDDKNRVTKIVWE